MMNAEQESKKSSRSIVDEQYFVNDKRWAVSLVGKRGTEHGYLLLQGQRNGKPCFYRTDLFLDGNQPIRTLGETAVGGYSASLFKEEKAEKVKQMHWDGRALVKLVEKDEAYFREIRDELVQHTWPIESEKGEQLLANVQQDERENIRYLLAGGGSSWSSVVSQCGNYHNCMSWAQEKLKQIGIKDVPRTTKDFIFVKPSAVLASARHESSCCIS